MATKADFTEAEWNVIEWGVVDAMTYTSYSTPGMWASFKEASAAAKYLSAQRESSSSTLVRDVVAGIKAKPDEEVAKNRVDMAGAASARIEQAAGILAEKAPDDLDAYKGLVLGVADAAAEASKGISPEEQAALDRIKAALA